ncbi:MAG: protein-tyrosine-phosphatase [Flavobacteriaceae bacterium]|nr:protein-tyrosine-phosphatase [Flavobacteriaceae bacterium]MCB0485453.1 protein-tyrosine-phosphatase [Flavobacteriaceae bacterium]
MKAKIYKNIRDTISSLDTTSIPEKRKPVLQQLIDYIQQKKDANENILLNFICTHNSRRSHFSQIWAQAIAAYVGLENVHCFSGGTEATALFPKVLETLEDQGFQIKIAEEGANPTYHILFAENRAPIVGFSKVYDHYFNPSSDFVAVMTCSHADENCPIVIGCDKRIALTYEDPKLFDGTPQQAEKYRERSLQIATELLYVFSNIN